MKNIFTDIVTMVSGNNIFEHFSVIGNRKSFNEIKRQLLFRGV